MRGRRAFLVRLAVGASLPLIAACGGAASPTAAPAKPTEAPKPAAAATTGGAAPAATSAPAAAPTKPAAAPAAGAPPAAAGRSTIRFLTWIGFLKPVVETFNKSQEKVSVTWEEVPFGQIADKLLVDLAAGTAPDAFHVPTSYWVSFMRRKITHPIDDLLKRDKVDASKFEFPPEKFAQLDGKTWGLPYGLPTSNGPAHNKRLFDEAGVKYPTAEWTWDDLTAAAKTLHKPLDRYAMTAIRQFPLLEEMIWSNGGAIVSDDGKKCMLGAPEAVEAVQRAVDWTVKDKITMQPGEEKGLGDVAFASDKLAIAMVSIGDWSSWKTATKNLAISAWATQWPVSPKTRKRVTSGGAHGLAIGGKTKNVEPAWQLLSWWQTDAEALKTQMQFLPVNYEFAKYIGTVPDPQQREWLSLRHQFLKEIQIPYWGPNTTEAQKAFTAEHDLALLGKKSVPDAMRDAAKAIDGILAG
jgi:multiple sugar transport system substrate-binding protein